MKFTEFQKLVAIEKEDKINDLEVGDFFLYGRNVINQLQNKQAGDSISYYEVLEIVENGVISYTPVFDTLEED